MVARSSNLHRVGLMAFTQAPPPTPGNDSRNWAENTNAVLAQILGKQPGDTIEAADVDKFVEHIHQNYLANAGAFGSFSWSWVEPAAKFWSQKIFEPWIGRKINEVNVHSIGQDTPQWVISNLLTPEAAAAATSGFTNELKSFADPTFGFFEVITKVVGALLDPANWVRFGALILGVFLLWKGVSSMREANV